ITFGCGRGREGQREHPLEPRVIPKPNAHSEVLEEQIAGASADAGSIGERDGVEELVPGPALRFTDLDAQQAVVPIEEAIQKSRVSSSKRSVQGDEGMGSEIASQLHAESQDLGVE